ncbi:hypothetical protein BJX64DRAFT_265607 [Aspergillus heterothallicus]
MASNCDSYYQRAQAENGSVELDADIVGPGVIASFIASSVTALFAVIVAFITYSIPTDQLNEIDDIIVPALRRVFSSIRSKLHWPNASKTNADEARADRLPAFQTFMLSITDQVLASHIAILIATFARHSDITLYSVNVVVALGCLAATVHLAMMGLLAENMRRHHIMKASRSLLMVASAVMLITLLVLQISDTWRDRTHIYFACAVRRLQVDVWYDPIGFATRLLVPLVIFFGYADLVLYLYSSQDPEKANWLGRIQRWYLELQLRAIDNRRKWLRVAPRKALEAKKSLRAQRLYALRYAESCAFHECQGSFLWWIIWLLSANVYGITAVFVERSHTYGISGDRDEMGYGQIVPLVLLVLPVLAAVQGVYDYNDRIKSTNGDLIPTTPSSGSSITDSTTNTSLPSISSATEIGSPDEIELSALPADKIPSRPITASSLPQDAPCAPATRDENAPGIFASPTLPYPESEPAEGIDRHLWEWA